MKTQIKYFTINFLNELINIRKDFVNITTGYRDINIISRYDNNIPQVLLYATEDFDGNVIVLENNTINTLIFEMTNTNDIRRRRQIGLYQIAICIAEVREDEDTKLFKYLIKQ